MCRPEARPTPPGTAMPLDRLPVVLLIQVTQRLASTGSDGELENTSEYSQCVQLISANVRKSTERIVPETGTRL